MNCQYHPLFRNCVHCGRKMARNQERDCTHIPDLTPDPTQRIKALREARLLIATHANMTWKSGQIERSDGITDVLVDFDLKFPEALEP